MNVLTIQNVEHLLLSMNKCTLVPITGLCLTLSVATGCKQVWPPAVKLQKTLKASEVQPKFGSIQNQPEMPQVKRGENRSTFAQSSVTEISYSSGSHETLTIIKLVMTVEQIFADTCRVLPRAQRLFDALDDGA